MDILKIYSFCDVILQVPFNSGIKRFTLKIEDNFF